MSPDSSIQPMDPPASGSDDDLDLGELLRVVLGRLPLVVLVTLGIGALAAAYAFLWPPTFEAVTTIKVPDSSSASVNNALKEMAFAATGGDPVETFVEVCRSETVAVRTARELRLKDREEYRDLTWQQLIAGLRKSVKIANVKKSNVLSITAQSGDSKLAADLANTWAKNFIAVNLELSRQGAASRLKFIEDQVAQLKDKMSKSMRLSEESKTDQAIYAMLLEKQQEARIAANVDDSGIVVVDTAVVPEKPVSPKKRKSVMLGLILGLALGIQLVFLVERMRDEVKYEEDLKRATKLPILAVIPDFWSEVPSGGAFNPSKDRFSKDHLIENPVFRYAFYRESFKVFRTNLTFALVDKPLRSVAVFSPGPEEGKTLVNANLALAVAETGKRVLLVDADLRKSSVARIFGMEAGGKNGLPSVLSGERKWNELVVDSGYPNLFLLPNYTTPPNPAELLGSEAMKRFVEEVKKEYDLVVFDGAPILPVTDSVVLASCLDGVVLMARWQKTHRQEAAKALEHLKAVRARLIGSVLNSVDLRRKLYGYGKYGYGSYGYGKYGYYGKKDDARKS